MHPFTFPGSRPAALQALGSFTLAAALLLASAPALAKEGVSVELASKIILKVLLLDQDLQAKTDTRVVVGVIGSDAAYRAFTSLKGEPIDQERPFKVAEVVRYDSMPSASDRPTLLFIGSAADPDRALAYTRRHKVLSATNVSGFVERGVTIGITAENNRPKVLVNLAGSEREGINWNPKILKIAKTIR